MLVFVKTCWFWHFLKSPSCLLWGGREEERRRLELGGDCAMFECAASLERCARVRDDSTTAAPRVRPHRLSRMCDTVHIAASEFGKPLLTAITDALAEKYPNKVVPDLGLCVTVYDIVDVGEAHIYAGNAAQHIAVEFRLVIFRPFVGEVLTGTVVAADPQGMRVSLGFFDEIHVPARALPTPNFWSAEEGVWVWNVSEDHQLFFDLENVLRFRVDEIRFREERNAPRKPGGAAAGGATQPGLASSAVGGGGGATGIATKGGVVNCGCTSRPPSAPTVPQAPPPPPTMLIVGGIAADGLGLTTWWPPDEDEPEEEEADDGAAA
jgi:DNA-directed RNA polymerase III subunit RPC8